MSTTLRSLSLSRTALSRAALSPLAPLPSLLFLPDLLFFVGACCDCIFEFYLLFEHHCQQHLFTSYYHFSFSGSLFIPYPFPFTPFSSFFFSLFFDGLSFSQVIRSTIPAFAMVLSFMFLKKSYTQVRFFFPFFPCHYAYATLVSFLILSFFLSFSTEPNHHCHVCVFGSCHGHLRRSGIQRFGDFFRLPWVLSLCS